MAPVVDFEGGFFDGEVFYAVAELVEEVGACGVEVFVVDAIDEDEMAEDVFGDVLAPAEGGACLEGGAHLLEEEIAVVVGEVAVGHVGVEEFEGFALGCGDGVHDAEELGAASLGELLSGLEVGVDLTAVVAVGDEVVLLAAGEKDDGCEGEE